MAAPHAKRPTDPGQVSLFKALGRVPSGVFVMTTPPAAGGRPVAMMVSWVQQAGFNPPAVCVAVAKDRPARPALESPGGGRFALSILEQSNSPLLKKYARGVPPDADPFEGVATQTSPGGIPILSDALGYLECRVLHLADFGGDHDLFAAEVTGGDLLREGTPFTHVRGSGAHY